MKLIFTQEEANAARKIIGELRTALEGTLNQDDESALWQCFKQSVRSGQVVRDIFGLNPLLQALQTASRLEPCHVGTPVCDQRRHRVQRFRPESCGRDLLRPDLHDDVS